MVAKTSPSDPTSGQSAEGKKNGKLSQLGLDKKQKKEVHSILKKAKEEIKALKANTSLDKKQKKQQIKDIKKNTKAQLKSILTPEQFQKFEQLNAQHKGGHKGGHSKGSSTPSAPATT